MGVLEEEKSRDVYEALQELYGQLLDITRFSESTKRSVEALRFQSEIHESYSTFIETFVEQLAAVSYGDLIYGRQVAFYLHHQVESPVRLAWNALSNAHVLELLPPLHCVWLGGWKGGGKGNGEGMKNPFLGKGNLLSLLLFASENLPEAAMDDDQPRYTCLKLELTTDSKTEPIFVEASWFATHFDLSIIDGLHAWICNALEKCFAEAEGYLEPVEDDEGILEAYVKSWVSGALDRASTRGSITFTLVLHHLSSFIFHHCTSDKLLLRNKLVESLLRDYSRKQQHEGMMLDFIQYNKPSASQNPEQNEGALQTSEIERRFEVLTEACEGNSSLLTEVEKLKSFFGGKQYVAT
ncbi:hypothetical protein L1049_016176 [Liquidambar formosana]|uniref:RPAP1/MINIYO-like TPR repeats domain-containing protein n=1 Tax=Liquidambar formosana TaxID=63359 RepID=A0AAP0RYX6_LIQFO